MTNGILSQCVLVALCGGTEATSSKAGLTNGGFEAIKDGLPVGWSSVVGDPNNRYEISADAHSGKHSLRLLRKVDKGELGFNRDWVPESGRQGAMLAELKGVLAFWYKIVRLSDSAEMQFMAIPMNARPYEESSDQRITCTVPREHAGDGQWHRAVLKYDYSKNPKVKWIHAAGRLNTGTGEVLVDDVEYLAKAGPLMEVTRIRVETIGDPEDERFRVSCLAANRGDEPTRTLDVSLVVPASCRIASAEQPGRSDPLGIDQQRELIWECWGRRATGDKIIVSVEGVGEPIRQEIELRPRLDVRAVPDSSILLGDKPVNLVVHIENTGTAVARDVQWTVALAPQAKLDVVAATESQTTVRVLLPGQTKRPAWEVTPTGASAAERMSIMVRSKDTDTFSCSREFVSLAGLNREHPEDIHLQGRGAELVFHGSELGYGTVSILAPKGEEDYSLVARMPRAGRVIIAHPNAPDEVLDCFGQLTLKPNSLTNCAHVVDKEGGKWTLTVEFTTGPAVGLIPIRYELTCDRDRAIRAFEGPTVWVGEGSFGSKKRDAIVPGIEWLWDGEISSSDLDFEPGHPHRLRYVPHPNELTWPIMAITHDRFGVGLMWDPNQRFDGDRRGPQPIFASPDQFSRLNHHLMGLMLPTVREMKRRNVRLTPEPVALKAGQKWTMTGSLWVNGAVRDSLAALDAWMDVNGLPEPPKLPRGGWAKEVGFSMTAYLQTLYDSKADGWLDTVGGPGALQFPLSPHPSFGFDILMGSRLADSEDVRRRCDQMHRRMFAERGLPVGADDFGYIMGRPDRMLAHMTSTVATLIHNQGGDGAWRFDADFKDSNLFKGFDYHELGPDEAAELGTCARKAYELLWFSRMTGDHRAYEAALKALAFMRRFEVPRAAQVWEVPVHSPDLLAAADAVDAYLEAYQIDGKQDHLTQAVRWARAGLPFIYVWGVPEYPWMFYGSIAVYGASWKKYSWIANPVQWNGLRYAYALIKLARYDKSRPWLRVATGITTSAMYQQNPDGLRKALWPDSIRVDEPGRSGWEFSPRLILKNVYAITGRDEAPTSTQVDGFVLSAVGRFREAVRTEDVLQIELEIPSPLMSWLLIARTTRPAEVRVGDQVIGALSPETPRLEKAGWIHRPDLSLLMVGLPKSGIHRVTIKGIEPQSVELVPTLRESIRFTLNRGFEGWQFINQLDDWKLEDGLLILRTTGADPFLLRPSLRVPTRSVERVVIRMKVDRGTAGQFYWATSDSPTINEAKTIAFKLEPGRMQEYRLDVGKHPRWTGDYITTIRIDPTDRPGATVEIDSVFGE